MKCRHCGSDIHWGDDLKPYKTRFQAAQPNPVVRDVPVRMRPAPTTPIQQPVDPAEESFVVENASEILNDLSSYGKKISEKKVANEKVNQALQRNINREREVWIVLSVAIAVAFLTAYGIWYRTEIYLPTAKVSEEISRYGTYNPNPYIPLNRETWSKLLRSSCPFFKINILELDLATAKELVDAAQGIEIDRISFPKLSYLHFDVARELLKLDVGRFSFPSCGFDEKTARLWELNRPGVNE